MEDFIFMIPVEAKLPDNCGNPLLSNDDRIMQGEPTKHGAFPWMAGIYIKGKMISLKS